MAFACRSGISGRRGEACSAPLATTVNEVPTSCAESAEEQEPDQGVPFAARHVDRQLGGHRLRRWTRCRRLSRSGLRRWSRRERRRRRRSRNRCWIRCRWRRLRLRQRVVLRGLRSGSGAGAGALPPQRPGASTVTVALVVRVSPLVAVRPAVVAPVGSGVARVRVGEGPDRGGCRKEQQEECERARSDDHSAFGRPSGAG